METIWNTMFLQIGRQGENGARVIRADVSEWLEDYPSGEVVLFVTRPTELTPYIPDGSSVADGILSWTVSGTDTGIAGTGRAELRLMDGDTIVKSEVVRTTVEPCLPGTDSPVPPTPEVTDWVTRFIDSAETVDEALANADAAVAEIDEAIAQAGDIVEVMQDKAPAILSTAGPADVATFTDGASGMPMEVTVALDPIQAGSGDPAPDNVREISGHSSVSVMAAGKNLLPGDYYNGDHYTVNGITFTVSDGKIIANGTATATAQYNILSRTANSFILPNGRYRLRGSPAGGGSTTWELGVSVTSAGGGTNTIGRDYRNNGEFDYTQSMGRISTYAIIRSGQTVENFTFEPMLTLIADADDPYEKPACATKTVTFPTPPGTVYGGTLTVNRDGTGKLVVDRGYYAFDGSEDWDTLASAENLYYLNAQSYGNFADVYLNATANDFAISNRYTQRTYSGVVNAQNGQFALGSPSGTSINRRIYVKDTACATVDDLKASLATTPMQLVFRLNTPITYDLTAEQVGQLTSVYGLNNVWSAGQVEVTYAADTKAYVDGTVGSTETVYNADGYEWVQVSGVPNYGYACEIPLAGIPRQNVAVIATVTSSTASDFSGFVAMLAPYYKVDVLAKKVTFYAAVPMYKITRVRAVYI